MKHEELAALLAEPTTPLMRAALRGLPPKTLETLAFVAEQAAEQRWRQVVAERVRAFADEQPDGPQAVTAYFTTTEQRTGSGMSVGWSPFIAALAPTEEMPDLRHTETTARMVPVGEAARAEEDFADPKLSEALHRLAALDPPAHADVLRVHLPTSRVTRMTP
ncbi:MULTISPECIES: hypothetical protein [Streptomyces]|uniref:hypothetical protein n=1 Tax=Streptomyces scabiei TaxID=1930 RepID=UPI001B32D190|nr:MULTISPECIES: hypothetical protein [Streptomyces]MBP5888636.1 hypothetical protein [Streptomyces sp. LBUM 1487]MDW8478508.1 hypothetical protein [Streptomyces scabiei]